MSLTPDQLARAVAERMLASETAAHAWGLELEEAREGYARAAMVIREDMLNGHRIGHGGMVFALADSVFAYACNSRNVRTVAQAASINFLSIVEPGERLTAEARESAVQGRTGVYDITITCGDRVVAVFQGLSRTLGGPVIENPA